MNKLLEIKIQIQEIEDAQNKLSHELIKRKKEWKEFSWSTTNTLNKLHKEREEKIEKLLINIK